MAGGLVHIWNEWAIRTLILFSFALQVFLFVFARTRRHGSCAVLRILLWLAYLMADSTAVYALGHLSFIGSPQTQKLAVFWAPFLLVHLGSQDTITSYALEDNQLWPRHLLNLAVQAFGVAYVLYKHITQIPTSLAFATGLMFFIGVIKYVERIWALKHATVDNIKSTINHYIPAYYGLPMRYDKPNTDEIMPILFAQAMLPLCMGGIINFPMALTSIFHSPPSYQKWNWKVTLKVVEIELSLMYDILYTKSGVIHTWYGYCIRVFSLLATVTAFILFHLGGNRNGYNKTDIAITYALLVGAFVLDMASLFSALGSTWSCILLWTRGWSKLARFSMFVRSHAKVASNRGWSGSIGQYKLIYFVRRPIRMLEKIGPEDWWNKWRYSEIVVISEDVKELVFKRVWQHVKMIQHPRIEDENLSTLCQTDLDEPWYESPYTYDEMPGFRPESYQDTARRRKKLDDALNFGVELHEAILTWHVFTDVFLLCSDTPKDAASFTYLKAIKALSDYMGFLIVVRPDMIPGPELRAVYGYTSDGLLNIHFDHAQNVVHTSADKVKRLSIIMQNSKRGEPTMSSIIFSHGTLYAQLLLELADAANPDKLGIISCYKDCDNIAMGKLKRIMPDLESSCRDGAFDMPKVLVLILDTLVRLLVWASIRCSRDAHARQISRGGELMTVVWLMEEHASAFFNRATDDGANAPWPRNFGPSFSCPL